ncbi:hypothetical protein HYH02_004452 [Chlamydomonas schloesseri]|uniref:Uncharacterized protein n=1 Tax=Chlamydomonas schloesseri TaxID=2026947 RepID=A0A835WMY5_9CHLO|nr:hypothetical protein HYH02_004452 [Chlamydomonas schloesseri]|eukprot:KAG2450612.1 hypothetical protein HYH02_004452 [Chlamydomonas schloesseri]
MGCGASVQSGAAAPGTKPHAHGSGSSDSPRAANGGAADSRATAAPTAAAGPAGPPDTAPPDAALVAAERAAAAAERAALAAHAALGAASAAAAAGSPGAKDAGSTAADGGGLLGGGLAGDLASFAAEALSSTCADLADALQHVPYAGAVFSTVRVFFARAQQVRQNQRLFLVLAMQVRSASECLVSAYRSAGRAVDVCPQRVMSELQQAVQAASDLMLDFTDRSWFVRLMIAPRIAEDAEHVHRLLTVAQQNLDSACMQYLVRHTAGATAGATATTAAVAAAATVKPQQEAFAAAQADMAALVQQLQQLLAAASAAGLALPAAAAAAALPGSLPPPPPPKAAAAACSSAADADDAGEGSGWGSQAEDEEEEDDQEQAAECKRQAADAGSKREKASSSKAKRKQVNDLSAQLATGLDLSRPYSAASHADQGTGGALPLLTGLQAMLLTQRRPKGKQSIASAAAPTPTPTRLIAAAASAPPPLSDTAHSSNADASGGSGGAAAAAMDADSLLHQLQALTGLDPEEVAEVTEDAIELLECRQDAAAEAARAGQSLPLGSAELLQLRRKQRQGKGQVNLVQPPLSSAEPVPAKCMAWVQRRRDKDKEGNVTIVPAHACNAKPKYRIQADEFAGHFFVCGNHRTLFDAYQHSMDQL